MIKYVDFDGVILDDENTIFEEYLYLESQGLTVEVLKYLIERNWDDILRNSKEINDSLAILRKAKDDVKILTKVNSLDNEATSKINFLRRNGIKQDIILVPFSFKKTDIVNATGNLLIDDTVHNLDHWQAAGGLSLFFDTNHNNIDSWHNQNKLFERTENLNIILSEDNEYIRKRCLKS